MSEYVFNRVNSKGEKTFKRHTGESIDEATGILDRITVSYETKQSAGMLKIYYSGQFYAYYPTTGRWNSYKSNGFPKKHYSAKNIKDFFERFLYGD